MSHRKRAAHGADDLPKHVRCLEDEPREPRVAEAMYGYYASSWACSSTQPQFPSHGGARARTPIPHGPRNPSPTPHPRRSHPPFAEPPDFVKTRIMNYSRDSMGFEGCAKHMAQGNEVVTPNMPMALPIRHATTHV